VATPADAAALVAAARAAGGPIVTPVAGADALVDATFCWVSGGEPEWVYLDANGLTERSVTGLLTRVEATPVWHVTLRAPAAWRGGYGFCEGVGEFVAPTGRDPESRSWWLGVFDGRRPDPFSSRPPYATMLGGECSEGAFPAAPPQARWDTAGSGSPVTMVHHTLSLAGVERSVWTHRVGGVPDGPAVDLTAVVFDGQLWNGSMPLAPRLDALPPSLHGALVVAVDSVDLATRARDLTCSTDFRAAVTDRLLPWAAGTLGASGARVVVAGQSYGGLAAADLALERSDVVSAAVCLSGSFWWPRRFDDESDRTWVWTERLAAVDPAPRPRLWLAAGALEADMLAVSERFAADARRLGYAVSSRSFCGGHDVVHWREQLLQGLVDTVG